MNGRTLLHQRTLVVSILMPLLFGCKTRTRESGETPHVLLDLSKVAPIGLEICADRPPQLSAANLDLQLQMPQRIAIPPDQQNFGAKSIEFRMGDTKSICTRISTPGACSTPKAISPWRPACQHSE